MSGGRLPKRIMSGNLEGGVRGRREGEVVGRADCVQSDIRAFGITRDWEVTVLKTEGWVERSRRVGGGSWPRVGKKM